MKHRQYRLTEELTADDGCVTPTATHSPERLVFESRGVTEPRVRAVLHVSLSQLTVAVGSLTGDTDNPSSKSLVCLLFKCRIVLNVLVVHRIFVCLTSPVVAVCPPWLS